MRALLALALALALGLAPALARAAEPSDALERKFLFEDAAESNPFSITPHRPTYVLPYTYSRSPNHQRFEELTGGQRRLQTAETKFQLSFRLPLWKEIGGKPIHLYAAYTQLSLWQAFNREASAPFRDTNYEPEAFFAFLTRHEPVLGFENRVVMVGAVHQSNGRGSQEQSRSWNRVFAEFVLSRGDFVLSLKPWYRIPERRFEDDNPEMEKFYGYGDIRARFKRRKHVASLLLRNNLRGSGNKGAVELGWSYPLVHQLRFYLQYYNGYGESLLDYDHPNQRIGAGVLLGEWL